MKRKTAQKINEQAQQIATSATDLYYSLYPEMEVRYGKMGLEESRQQAAAHLLHLSEAILASSQDLFQDHVSWALESLVSHNKPARELSESLNCIKQVLAQRLPIENYIIAAKYMNAALLQLEMQEVSDASYLQPDAPYSALAAGYLTCLMAGDRAAASRLVRDKVAAGTGVKDIYLHVFQPVQYEIGRLWQQQKLTVAQEHYCTAATALIMSQLHIPLFDTEKNGFKLLATCITGDLHELGLRMVTDFFEMEGWDVYYLGANTPICSILEALHTQKPHLLLLSATMAYHVHAITELITAVRAAGDLQDIKIMVGGIPFNAAPEIWKKTGADMFATNAGSALSTAAALIQTHYARAV